MIEKLNFDGSAYIYVWSKISEEIESSFKDILMTDTLYYYYQVWGKNNTYRTMWVGNVSFLQFIKILLDESNRGFETTPFVTSAFCLENIGDEEACEDRLEKEIWGPEGRPEIKYQMVPVGKHFRMEFDQTDEDKEKAQILYQKLQECQNDYWIGDFGKNGDVQCCDELIDWLWRDVDTHVKLANREQEINNRIWYRIRFIRKLFKKWGKYEPNFLEKWEEIEWK